MCNKKCVRKNGSKSCKCAKNVCKDINSIDDDNEGESGIINVIKKTKQYRPDGVITKVTSRKSYRFDEEGNIFEIKDNKDISNNNRIKAEDMGSFSEIGKEEEDKSNCNIKVLIDMEKDDSDTIAEAISESLSEALDFAETFKKRFVSLEFNTSD